MPSLNAPAGKASTLATAQQPSGRLPSLGRAPAASEVLPRLYLTDLYTARNDAQITTLGITHIVSVIDHAPNLPQKTQHSLQTLHIPLSDSPDQDILAHLPTTTSFIINALAESPDSRVMVHCFMGISRSATVVCAYLVATMGMTPADALAAVREKRAIVRPNVGFLLQLEEYAAQVQGGGGEVRARRAKTEAIRKLTGGPQPKELDSSTAGVSPSPGTSPSLSLGQ